MPDLALLKYARARDDSTFGLRVSAALMVEALYRVEAKPAMSVEAKAMMNWVLDNPLQPIELMNAFAATHQPISDAVTITDGAVSTAGVHDSDITYIVGAKWDAVATKRFTAA